MNIPSENLSASSQDTPDIRKEHIVECAHCNEKLDMDYHVYESLLVKLYEEIEKMPETYESKCPSCKSIKIIPSFRWGRYCETPGCKYKLPAPFATVSMTGSQAEDICSAILDKFDDTVRCKKCSMPAEHTLNGWVCLTNGCKLD